MLHLYKLMAYSEYSRDNTSSLLNGYSGWINGDTALSLNDYPEIEQGIRLLYLITTLHVEWMIQLSNCIFTLKLRR
jgi:hypothetical protein